MITSAAVYTSALLNLASGMPAINNVVTVEPAPVIETVCESPKGGQITEYQCEIKKIIEERFGKNHDLVQIAFHESSWRHVNEKTSQVVININYDKNGKSHSRDIGVFQINDRYHGKKAQELGLDLYSFEDNLAYAEYLYEKQGIELWTSKHKVLASR